MYTHAHNALRFTTPPKQIFLYTCLVYQRLCAYAILNNFLSATLSLTFSLSLRHFILIIIFFTLCTLNVIILSLCLPIIFILRNFFRVLVSLLVVWLRRSRCSRRRHFN